MEGNCSFRNRQVASSTLALGSRIFNDLRIWFTLSVAWSLQRKHAILLATVILTARRLQPLLEEDDKEMQAQHGASMS
jgi:hypothetical protein